MEFSCKLQEIRKQRGLTQEQLASSLFVSRAAISKWESGRGYPNIDSLREIAKFFSITVDELLQGEELLSIAEKESKQNKSLMYDIVFGLCDISCAALLFMPFFGQKIDNSIYTVSLLNLKQFNPYLRVFFFAVIIGLIVYGIITLALQKNNTRFWERSKNAVSLALTALGLLLFIVSSQPYAAIYLFIFLSIKVLLFIKKR